MKSISSTEAQNRFGELIEKVQREPMTISRKGRPVMVMMSIHDYENVNLARLRAHAAEGEAAIERGEFTTIRNKEESHTFFEKIKAKNRNKKA